LLVALALPVFMVAVQREEAEQAAKTSDLSLGQKSVGKLYQHFFKLV